MGSNRAVDIDEIERSKLSFLYQLRNADSHKIASVLGASEETKKQYLGGQIAETKNLCVIEHHEKLSAGGKFIVATRFMMGASDSESCVYVAKLEETNEVWLEKVDAGKKTIEAYHEEIFGQDRVTTMVSGVTSYSKKLREAYVYQQYPDEERERIGMLRMNNDDLEYIDQNAIHEEFIKGYRSNALVGALGRIANYISECYDDRLAIIRPKIKEVVQKHSIVLDSKDENGNNEVLVGPTFENPIPTYVMYYNKKMSFIVPMRYDSNRHQDSYSIGTSYALLEDVMSMRPIPDRSEHGDDNMYV